MKKNNSKIVQDALTAESISFPFIIEELYLIFDEIYQKN